MTAAHGQAITVCKSCQIVRVRRVHDKADYAAAVFCRPNHSQTWNFGHSFQRISGKIDIVLKNFGAPDPFDIIDRRAQSDRAGDIRRARFETVRRFLK